MNVFGHYVRNSTLLPNQKRVTQEEFEKIALASVEELWSNYMEMIQILEDDKVDVIFFIEKYQK